jgi:hypothetical protein
MVLVNVSLGLDSGGFLLLRGGGLLLLSFSGWSSSGNTSGGNGSGWLWWTLSDHGLELGHLRRALQVHEWKWRRRQVLVRVETSDGGDVSDVGYLNHGVLLAIVADVLVGRKWRKRVWALVRVVVIVVIITVLIPRIVTVFLQFLGHWREGDTFWEIWERINESSLLIATVVEGAAFTELAVTVLTPVFARNCFVI